MDCDAYLTKMTLLDCTGHVSHTLILAIDGNVDIEFSDGRRATVDVCEGINRTPHLQLPAALLQEAIAFGKSAL